MCVLIRREPLWEESDICALAAHVWRGLTGAGSDPGKLRDLGVFLGGKRGEGSGGLREETGHSAEERQAR